MALFEKNDARFEKDEAPWLFPVRSLPYKVHKLVELGGDDNLRAPVALLAQLGVVAGQRIIFTSAAGSEPLGVYTILLL